MDAFIIREANQSKTCSNLPTHVLEIISTIKAKSNCDFVLRRDKRWKLFRADFGLYFAYFRQIQTPIQARGNELRIGYSLSNVSVRERERERDKESVRGKKKREGEGGGGENADIMPLIS